MYEINILTKNYSSNPVNTIVTKYHSSSTTDYKRPVSKHSSKQAYMTISFRSSNYQLRESSLQTQLRDTANQSLNKYNEQPAKNCQLGEICEKSWSRSGVKNRNRSIPLS